MKVVYLSDTHGRHHEIPEIPRGDVICHLGDFTLSGIDNDFFEWFGNLPHRYKLLVPGNHDYDIHIYRQRALGSIYFLEDMEVIDIDGTIFCGLHSTWENDPLKLLTKTFKADVILMHSRPEMFRLLEVSQHLSKMGVHTALYGHFHEERGLSIRAGEVDWYNGGIITQWKRDFYEGKINNPRALILS